jgi:hypothetical protein
MEQRPLLRLAQLPKDIYRILLEYLTVKDLVAFENANTSFDTRSLFLSALDGLTLSFLSEPLTKKAMQWILLRNISMKVIIFGDFGHEGVELVSKCRSTIQSLSFPRHFSHEQFLEIGYCPSLRSLSLASCPNPKSHQSLQDILRISTQLQRLDPSANGTLSVQTIPLIAEYCPNLTHLFLRNNSWVTDESIPLLIASCPNLKALDLRWTNVTQSETIRLVIDSLPRLCYLAYSPLGTVISEVNLRKIALPAIFGDDVEAQELGVMCLVDLFLSETYGQSSPEDPLPSHHHVLDRMLAGSALDDHSKPYATTYQHAFSELSSGWFIIFLVSLFCRAFNKSLLLSFGHLQVMLGVMS